MRALIAVGTALTGTVLASAVLAGSLPPTQAAPSDRANPPPGAIAPGEKLTFSLPLDSPRWRVRVDSRSRCADLKPPAQVKYTTRLEVFGLGGIQRQEGPESDGSARFSFPVTVPANAIPGGNILVNMHVTGKCSVLGVYSATAAWGPYKVGAVKRSIFSETTKQIMREGRNRLVTNAENVKAAGTAACIVKTGIKEGARAAWKAAAQDLGKSMLPGDFPPTDPCSFIFVAAEGGMYIPALAMDAIANDPPDPNFDELVEAKTKARFSVRTTTKKAGPIANAINAEVANGAKVRGFLVALLTSVERAQGAEAAGQSMWVARQMKAARGFAAQAAVAMSKEPGLRSRLSAALRGAGFPSITLDASTAAAVRKRFASEGLSSGERRALRFLGAAAAEIRSLDAQLKTTTTSELTGLRFPQLLTDANALAALRAAAGNLRAFARG